MSHYSLWELLFLFHVSFHDFNGGVFSSLKHVKVKKKKSALSATFDSFILCQLWDFKSHVLILGIFTSNDSSSKR